MKKIVFLALASALFFSGCVDFNEPEAKTEEESYRFNVNSSVVLANDTIYAGVGQEILSFVTDANENIVNTQIDFGDGVVDGGTQILHSYKTAGIFQIKATVVEKNVVLNRVAKITAPSVVTVETIIQLSGNTVGDSASIKLLCLKSKIYNWNKVVGKYFIKGDMTGWKRAIEATDTNYLYNGERYLLFSFKLKNYAWTSFGYYKVSSTSEHWGYDPNNKFWNNELGLYRVYVSGAQIYANQTTAEIPGAAGDAANSANGPCVRLDYQTNGFGNDSIVIYANRNYLSTTDSTKLGIGYTVDGGATVIKKASFLKNTKYIFVKVPVTKSSTVRFKTYKDINTLATGDMTSSIFYRAGTGDCYLTIAGTIQKVPGLNGSRGLGVSIIAANGERFNF